MSRSSLVLCAAFLAALAARTATATTAEDIDRLERQQEKTRQEIEQLRQQIEKKNAPVAEVERRQGILARELAALREAFVLPESQPLRSAYGLGPAASKVYHGNPGLSIGGYGESSFRAAVADDHGSTNTFDYVRFVLYAGYKYSDWIVLNTEIEFEHASTEATASADDGAVEVEFATLDFLFDPRVNARAGMVLVPMGFINELHEPPFYHGNRRPPVETQILPSTWRSNGFGIFGELLPGLEYRTYGITSLNAKGFRSDGIRGGRQSGNREFAEDWSWVARIDYQPFAGAEAGGSLLIGDQGQDESYGNDIDGFFKADVFTQIYEGHIELRRYGLELRGLIAAILVDDAGILSTDPEITGFDPAAPPGMQPAPERIADVMLGYYGEIAYDVLPLVLPDTTQYLAPWFRGSHFNTQESMPRGFPADGSKDRNVFEFGIDYKPITQVVLKLDVAFDDAEDGTLPDEIAIGTGFVF